MSRFTSTILAIGIAVLLFAVSAGANSTSSDCCDTGQACCYEGSPCCK